MKLFVSRLIGTLITILGFQILIESNGTSLLGAIIAPIGMLELVFVPIYSFTLKKLLKW